MELNIINVIIKVMSTALPGYFTYYVFQKFNIITLSPKKVHENAIILSAFSALNILIGLILYQNNNQVVSAMLVIKIMLTLSLLTVIILPCIVRCIQKSVGWIMKKMNLGMPNFTTNWKLAFGNNNAKIIHIYTLSGEFIYSGEVAKASESNEWDYYDFLFENNLELYPATEKETLAAFKQLESENCIIKVYLDIEKGLKYYILEYQNN